MNPPLQLVSLMLSTVQFVFPTVEYSFFITVQYNYNDYSASRMSFFLELYRIRERRSVVQGESRLKKRNNIARTPRTDKKMSLKQMRSQLRNVGLELGANASPSDASAPHDDSMTGTASTASSALPVQHTFVVNLHSYCTVLPTQRVVHGVVLHLTLLPFNIGTSEGGPGKESRAQCVEATRSRSEASTCRADGRG